MELSNLQTTLIMNFAEGYLIHILLNYDISSITCRIYHTEVSHIESIILINSQLNM